VHQGRCLAHMFVMRVAEELEVWPEYPQRKRAWVSATVHGRIPQHPQPCAAASDVTCSSRGMEIKLAHTAPAWSSSMSLAANIPLNAASIAVGLLDASPTTKSSAVVLQSCLIPQVRRWVATCAGVCACLLVCLLAAFPAGRCPWLQQAASSGTNGCGMHCRPGSTATAGST
jgi:hypothetical protein